jgi:hypothetical protein
MLLDGPATGNRGCLTGSLWGGIVDGLLAYQFSTAIDSVIRTREYAPGNTVPILKNLTNVSRVSLIEELLDMS